MRFLVTSVPAPCRSYQLQRIFVIFVKKSASHWCIGHCTYLIYTPMPNLAVMRDLVEVNLCLSTFTRFYLWPQRAAMDQIRRKPHAHEAQHSSRLVRLIRILRCLCGCQDLMFRLTCARSVAHIKSPFFSLSNGSRMTAGKRISTFKTHLILYSGVYGIMIRVKEKRKEK